MNLEAGDYLIDSVITTIQGRIEDIRTALAEREEKSFYPDPYLARLMSALDGYQTALGMIEEAKYDAIQCIIETSQ